MLGFIYVNEIIFIYVSEVMLLPLTDEMQHKYTNNNSVDGIMNENENQTLSLKQTPKAKSSNLQPAPAGTSHLSLAQARASSHTSMIAQRNTFSESSTRRSQQHRSCIDTKASLSLKNTLYRSTQYIINNHEALICPRPHGHYGHCFLPYRHKHPCCYFSQCRHHRTNQRAP